jgi:hypothetical protein
MADASEVLDNLIVARDYFAATAADLFEETSKAAFLRIVLEHSAITLQIMRLFFKSASEIENGLSNADRENACTSAILAVGCAYPLVSLTCLDGMARFVISMKSLSVVLRERFYRQLLIGYDAAIASQQGDADIRINQVAGLAVIDGALVRVVVREYELLEKADSELAAAVRARLTL